MRPDVCKCYGYTGKDQPSAVIMIANPLCMHKGNGFNFVSMINTVIFIKEKVLHSYPMDWDHASLGKGIACKMESCAH